MLRYLPYFIIFSLTLGLLVVMESVRPDLVSKILISIDVFGLTENAHLEKERISKINNLNLTYEEKQVLINRTVFLGSTEDMVKLALGEPKKIYAPNTNVSGLLFVYYLPDDKRPTVLEFNNHKLEKAYKGSAIDLQ